MNGLKKSFYNLSNRKKNVCVIIIILLVLLLSIGLPTFARYKNRVVSPDIMVWDGSVANSYRSGSGTEFDPYIISNGSELAYFSAQLETNDYQDTYFSLNGNIILNNGNFSYDKLEGLKYNLDNNSYYLENYSSKYYSDINKTGSEVGNINVFNSLNGFKGHFDGNLYSIYGLYITDSNKENLGLFTNLEGSVKNLYVSNSLIYGGIATGGIVSNSNNSIIENVIFNGLAIGQTENNEVTGGIVGIANNTILTNTINKGKIIGFSISGGLIGKGMNEISINQSYNIGEINSTDMGGGLIGLIENNTMSTNITNSYNNATINSSINGGLIGKLSNSFQINITNTFNTSETNSNVGLYSDSILNLTKVYFTSNNDSIKKQNIIDGFIYEILDNLKDKDYVLTNLFFNEFVNESDVKTNTSNVWIYGNKSLPILYIDDSDNVLANIHVSTYKWNNYSDTLNTISVNNNITFTIAPTNPLNQYEIYYYISPNKEVKTKNQLDSLPNWNTYDDVVKIENEGEYIIYSKIVYSNNITYLNTDILRLDKTNPIVEISLDDNKWNDFRDDIPNTYINREKQVEIEASDTLSNVQIEYYISNDIKTKEQLNSVSWNKYENQIVLNNIGKYIVYTKITNENNLVTLANTDMIVFNGYTNNSLSLGRNKTPLSSGAYITNNSTITLNFTYQNNESTLTNVNHSLVSNTILPDNSIITIIDKNNNKIYEYKTLNNNDKYIYPFTLFNEIGKLNQKYIEQSYNVNEHVDENFDIILDLSRTNINTNYDNVSISLEVNDSNNNNIRPTLNSTIKSFNIYSNLNGELYLNTDYSNIITFNRDFSNEININSGIDYKSINSNVINDSSFENKNIGLLLRMVDSNGENVSTDFYKNIKVKIDDKIYYPYNNIITINLENGIKNINKTLSIITTNNNSNLGEGTYYFKISNYVSYGEYCSNELGNSEISIPAIIEYDRINANYNFDVMIEEDSRIINKNSINPKLTFKILQNAEFNNLNMRVSLYKKDTLDPINQDYSLVDLQNYVNDTLSRYSSNIYYVSTNPLIYNGNDNSLNTFELSLNTNSFENTGYKFVFDLYSDNKRIGTIEKKFIVK